MNNPMTPKAIPARSPRIENVVAATFGSSGIKSTLPGSTGGGVATVVSLPSISDGAVRCPPVVFVGVAVTVVVLVTGVGVAVTVLGAGGVAVTVLVGPGTGTLIGGEGDAGMYSVTVSVIV